MPTTDLPALERRLWSAADQLRANSSLTPAEYRSPVLGLIFLAFAEPMLRDAIRTGSASTPTRLSRSPGSPATTQAHGREPHAPGGDAG